jgi:Cu/Ag efflux protein CusF
MTMMFKVQDPALLEGIETDTEVDFDIDNSSGGFEITNIKPTSQ